MTVILTPAQEEIVDRKVQSGRYTSASDVVREALSLLDERDGDLSLRLDEIRRKIDEGWESLRRGDWYDGDEVFDQLEAELGVDVSIARGECLRGCTQTKVHGAKALGQNPRRGGIIRRVRVAGHAKHHLHPSRVLGRRPGPDVARGVAVDVSARSQRPLQTFREAPLPDRRPRRPRP